MKKSVSKQCDSFSCTDSTTRSEDEIYSRASLLSLMEQTEGFESGFESLDDFLQYSPSSSTASSSNSQVPQDEHNPANNTNDTLKTTRSSKLKMFKTKLKTSLKVKKKKKKKLQEIRHRNPRATLLRAISNGIALVFRGFLFLTVNFLIVCLILAIV